MRTIFVLFGDYHQAAAAVEELIDNGFDREEMNAIIQAAAVRAGARRPHLAANGRVGGMDALMSECKIVDLPGVGEALAAGPEAQDAAASTQEGEGASVADALTRLGVPEELAELYESGIGEGGLLFWVRVAEERFDEASDILAGAMDRRVANYN
jgi:hypothetical protein